MWKPRGDLAQHFHKLAFLSKTGRNKVQHGKVMWQPRRLGIAFPQAHIPTKNREK